MTRKTTTRRIATALAAAMVALGGAVAVPTASAAPSFATAAVQTSSVSVDDEDEVVEADGSSVSVSDFRFRVTDVEDAATITVRLTGDGASATWSAKPTVKVNSVAVAKSSLTISGSTLTIPVPGDVTGTATIRVSGVTVNTGSGDGTVSLLIRPSGGTSITVDYFVVEDEALSLSSIVIPRSTGTSVTYAAVGTITLTVAGDVTASTLRLTFSHEDDDATLVGLPAASWTSATTPTVSSDTDSTLTAQRWTGSGDEITLLLGTGGKLEAGRYTIRGVRLAAYTAGEIEVSVSGAVSATASNVIVVDSSGESRIAGSDRYATSAELALDYWNTPSTGQGTVIVVNGEQSRGGADALAASYLAGQVGAPVLLVTTNAVPSSVLVALTAQASANGGDLETIYVLGDTSAVSSAVVSTLVDLVAGASDVVRISGSDRFATSAKVALAGDDVAELAVDDDADELTTAFLANGWTPVDALVAGSLAYQGHPVLLTDRTALPDAVADAIEELGIEQVVVLGATASVSAAVVSTLESLDVEVERLAGATRFDTAELINEIALDDDFGLDFDAGTAYLFDGYSFADALSASALAGVNASPLVPTWSGQLAGASLAFLTDWASAIDTVTALGGTDRVASGVLSAAAIAAE